MNILCATSIIVLSSLAAAPQEGSASGSSENAQAVATQDIASDPETEQPDPVADSRWPRFRLESALTKADPSAFANDLSTLLGVEIRLPAEVSKELSLAPGEWTTRTALNAVSEQLGASWRPVFAFGPAVKGGTAVTSEPTPSKLPSWGQVSLSIQQLSFAKSARLISEAVGCTAEVPWRIPGRYTVICDNLAVEQALEELATQAGLAVSTVIVFELPVSDPAVLIQRQLRAVSVPMLSRLELAAWLRETTDQDPYAADFPWEHILIAPEVAAQMDLTSEQTAEMLGRIRFEAEMVRKMNDRLVGELQSGKQAKKSRPD